MQPHRNGRGRPAGGVRMSEDLLDAEVSVTRYWGGSERGVCYQVTENEHRKREGDWVPYVRGTKAQMVAVALAILKDAAEDATSTKRVL